MNLFVRLKDMENKTEYYQTIQIKSGIKINGSVLTLKEIKKEKKFLAMSLLNGYADGKIRYAGCGDKILSVDVF